MDAIASYLPDYDLDRRPRSLTEWIHYFNTYFQKPNTQGENPRPLRDFTERLAELGGYLTSTKHQPTAAFVKYYAKFFAWYCGLVASARLPIEDEIWLRFPGCCPYCGKKPCMFLYNPALRIHRTANRENIRAMARQTALANGWPRLSLSQWFSHFMDIYPPNIHYSTVEISERLHEELSELIRHVRESELTRDPTGAITDSANRNAVVSELADLLSWYLTLGAKVLLTRRDEIVVKEDAESRLEVEFDTIIHMIYSRGCDNCGLLPCDCERWKTADRSDLSSVVTEDTPKPNDGDLIFDFVSQLKELDLPSARVIGNFVAAPEGGFGELRRMVDRLKELLRSSEGPVPIFLCAPPGSGKTYFVDEFSSSLGVSADDVVYDNLSTATSISHLLLRHYARITATDSRPRIAFLDEVDTVVGGETAFRYLLGPISGDPVEIQQGAAARLRNILWFFAASSAGSAAELREYLSSISKGPDFLRRIREKGLILEIPPISSVADRAYHIAVGVVRGNPRITHVNADALFCLLTVAWEDASHLAGEVLRIAKRSEGKTFLALEDLALMTGFTGFVNEHYDSLSLLSKKPIVIRQ
jgi:hypothetical protein